MSVSFSLINGEPGDCLPVTDRGLTYGDGLFETIKVADRTPVLLNAHLDRLIRDADRLKIPVDSQLIDSLSSDVHSVCRFFDHTEAVVKIVLTRGSGGRGYRLDPHGAPSRIVSIFPRPDYPAHYGTQGVRLCLCQTRLGLNPQLAGIKHLNRLEQVLARSEWNDEYQEGVLLDGYERVVEGTMSNLFVVKSGRLLTPRLDEAGVAGVMRQVVIDQARAHGVEVAETELLLHDLMTADGLLLTNSLIGCWPVTAFDNARFSIPVLYSQVCHWIAQAEVAQC